MYKAIDIDEKELSIMGVKFHDKELFETVSNAIGTNMFEGFEPSTETVALIKSFVANELTNNEFVLKAKSLNV